MPKPTIGQTDWGGTLNSHLDTLARKVHIEALDYGDLSSDTADAAANVLTLQAAATAAGSLRADVQVPGMSIPINDQVTWPEWSGLVGAGMEHTTFLATHADAELVFVAPSWAYVADFTFDGNDISLWGVSVGKSGGGCHKMYGRNVRVIDTAGHSLYLYNIQNSEWHSPETSGNYYGLEMLGGCGSVDVFNHASNNNDVFQCKVGNQAVQVGGYAEPTACAFYRPMYEQYAETHEDAVAGMIVTGASRLQIFGGNLLSMTGVPGLHIERDTANGNGDCEVIAYDTSIWGDNNAGAAYIKNGSLRMIGRGNFQMVTGPHVILDGAGARLYGDGFTFNGGSTTGIEYRNGASWHGNRRVARTEAWDFYADPGWVPTFRIGEKGNDAFNLFLYGDGRLGFGSNAYAEDVTLQRGGADLMTMADGDSLRVQGTWNGGMLRLGDYRLWVDSTGDLRIKNGAPSSDTDGVVVGSQS